MAWMPQVRDRSGKATVEKGKKYMSCSSIQAGPTNISIWNTALYTFKSVPLSTSEFSVEMLHFLKQLNCLIPRNCSMTRWCYSLSPYAQRTELTFEFVHAWALIKTFVKLMHLNRFYPVSSKEPVLVVHMKCHTGQKPLLSSRIDTDMHFSAQHFLKLKNPSTLPLFYFCSTVYTDKQNDALLAQLPLVWNQITISSSFMANLAPKNEHKPTQWNEKCYQFKWLH